MPETYKADRQSVKADIEAAGCPCKILNRNTFATVNTAALILNFSFIERLGGAVLDGDVKLMVPALGNPEPLTGEVYDIVIDTTDPLFRSAVGVYQIVDPHPFMIGGPVLWYDIQGRRR